MESELLFYNNVPIRLHSNKIISDIVNRPHTNMVEERKVLVPLKTKK